MCYWTLLGLNKEVVYQKIYIYFLTVIFLFYFSLRGKKE